MPTPNTSGREVAGRKTKLNKEKMDILTLAKQNQQTAWKIVEASCVIPIWESVGAKVNLVGSLRTGLLMTHRDIDFHIYSSPVTLSDSFRAMAKLAENPAVEKIECVNLLHTPEACVEWHAWYRHTDNELWQIDMIHIAKGSRYDGYFEEVADRIAAVLTEETRQAILKLKYDTPESVKIMGIEYYEAVLRDGVRTYPELVEWREKHPVAGVVEWMPDVPSEK